MWLGRKYAEAFNVKDAEYLSIVEDLLILEGVKQMDKHIQHSDITTLEHTLCVSFIAFVFAKSWALITVLLRVPGFCTTSSTTTGTKQTQRINTTATATHFLPSKMQGP